MLIDSPHGGFDGGAVANDGTMEKNLNLEISNKAFEILKSLGYNVIMIRETDTAVDTNNDKTIKSHKASDLKNRLGYMKKYDDAIYVSIHMNKFPQSYVHGAQVFYSAKIDDSKMLADEIQNSISVNLQKDNKRAIKPSTNNIYILHNATIPAVIVECGFLSNQDDLTNLKSDEYQNKMAFSIIVGIMNYYNLK